MPILTALEAPHVENHLILTEPPRPLKDGEVLHVLYRSTGGAHWNNNTNWDTDADLAIWHGVETNDQGRVLTLGPMGYNNIQGMIDPNLSHDVLDLPQEFIDRSGPLV